MMDVTARPARPEDAAMLVDFVMMAGEGLAEIAWAELTEPGQTLRDVGLARAARETGAFSYRNATIFESAGEPVGGLVGYRLPDAPVEIGPDFPPAFVPLQELENLASGAWYLNILAVYEPFRDRGLGRQMLLHAEELAAKSGATDCAIIVFSANPGAERLYRRVGYREVARRRVEIDGWRHSGTEAVLLMKGR